MPWSSLIDDATLEVGFLWFREHQDQSFVSILYVCDGETWKELQNR